MALADVSIKRPIFITCLVLAMLAVGYLSFKKLGIDQFPNVNFPVVVVTVPYLGAGPEEIETLVAKPLEEELSTVPGLKALRAICAEGVARVVGEFTLETDIKYAEQVVKDRVTGAKRKLPADIKEPIIRRIDPSDLPIATIAINSDLTEGQLFDVVDNAIKPKFEQVAQVGLVEINGARKREIHIELDVDKLKKYELSASLVSQRLGLSGQNVPAGKFDEGKIEKNYRTIGEFKSLPDIQNTVVNFLGNDVPVKVSDVGTVIDTLEDETSRTYVNGKKAVFLQIYRQSGANTIAVTEEVKKRLTLLQEEFSKRPGNIKISMVRDGGKMIRANVDDVKDSIMLGILLTIVVVYLFLGSIRSTLITGLALPNSLLGAFVLMSAAGFTINVMTLLALSLSVGLLVDDAIVVRENIFRHIEMGKNSIAAALEGTKEVTLAVLATTLTVIAVFGPIGFLKGVVGQFFKEFGLTICFAMAISLFDALTMAPMLSAYFAGASHKTERSFLGKIFQSPVILFNWMQDRFEQFYMFLLHRVVRRPWAAILLGIGVLFASFIALKKVPKTFLSAQDFGEFSVSLDLPPGTSIEVMNETARKVDERIHSNKEIALTTLTVGNSDGQANLANFYVTLVPSKQRSMNTSEFKEILRQQLKDFAYANPAVKDFDVIGGGMRPFALNIIGPDLKVLEQVSDKVFQRLKKHPALKDVDTNFRPGKPELRVEVNRQRAEYLGVSSNMIGAELRNLIQGTTPAVYRQGGEQYDIRVLSRADQRDLGKRFNTTYVPNINNSLVRLHDVSTLVAAEGPATINRQDRGRYVQVMADLAPDGPGMGGVMSDINQMFATEIKLPPGVRYAFIGQAENFRELIENIMLATILSIIFIYLVLASLYESFVTPVTIMSVLWLALSGAFFALAITGKSLDINSMIGCILLLGIATKNSILLVDYALQQVEKGSTRIEAVLLAGQHRLRPILMTTVALIAGMLPIAIGLNEASRQRTSMGVAIIGGLITSTLLSLLIVPAVFLYIDRFRVWAKNLLTRVLVTK